MNILECLSKCLLLLANIFLPMSNLCGVWHEPTWLNEAPEMLDSGSLNILLPNIRLLACTIKHCEFVIYKTNDKFCSKLASSGLGKHISLDKQTH